MTLDPDESHHLSTVLRGGREEILHLVDGNGLRMTARSAGRQGRQELVELITVSRDEDEVRVPLLVLVCAVAKGKRFEWALEKAVELGVNRIVPLTTERGSTGPGSAKTTRWRTIMISALKQSGRAWLPILDEGVRLQEALADPDAGQLLFGAVPGELPTDAAPVLPWTSLLQKVPGELPGALTLLIGPEGGWSPAEQDQLLAKQAVPVDLGAHVLRTETAAVVGVSALQSIRRFWLDRSSPSGS